MLTLLGMNIGREFFWGGGAEMVEKQGRTIWGKISPSNFAEKFAGNFAQIRRSAEPRAQPFLYYRFQQFEESRKPRKLKF